MSEMCHNRTHAPSKNDRCQGAGTKRSTPLAPSFDVTRAFFAMNDVGISARHLKDVRSLNAGLVFEALRRWEAGNLHCPCPLLDVCRNRFRKLRRVAADRFDTEF
jgi:hypothetical protein